MYFYILLCQPIIDPALQIVTQKTLTFQKIETAQTKLERCIFRRGQITASHIKQPRIAF